MMDNKIKKVILIFAVFLIFSGAYVGLHEYMHVLINDDFGIDSKIYLFGACNEGESFINQAVACTIANGTQISMLNENQRISLNELQENNEIIGYPLLYISVVIIVLIIALKEDPNEM